MNTIATAVECVQKNAIVQVMVVDDHPVIHEGLEYILNREDDIAVCATAENVNDALAGIEKHQPDIVLIDITLKGSASGIDLIEQIRTYHRGIKTLVLSMFDEELYAERVIRAGANGYLMKEELRGTIVSAIRTILAGQLFLSDKMTARFLNDLLFDQSNQIGNSIEKLSNREFEVFQLIGQGYKTIEIAEKLNVSAKTIGTHRFRMQEKLNIKNSAQLVKYAIEWLHTSSHKFR